MNILDSPGQTGVSAHSSLWLWELVEFPQLEEDGWGPGGKPPSGRHRNPLRKTWHLCGPGSPLLVHFSPDLLFWGPVSDTTLPSETLQAATRRTLCGHSFWLSNTWHGLSQYFDGTEQCFHFSDEPHSKTVPHNGLNGGPPQVDDHVQIPGTCECDLMWKMGLWRCD